MSADLHIHIKTEEMSERDLECFFSCSLGSKYFRMDRGGNKCLDKDISQCDCQHWKHIEESTSVWVGEVSWLKAALTGKPKRYVPPLIERIHNIIGEGFRVIDDLLIAKIRKAFSLKNETGYDLAYEAEIIKFLEENKGKECFTVSW